MTTTLHTDRTLIYRTANAPNQPRRLLVLAHGVGGNETNLLSFAADAPEDTAVVFVRAPLTMGPNQFAWFPVSFGAQGPRPDLAAAEASRQKLATFIEEMQALYGIGARETVVAGFSQGGIMSASVALTRPELLGGFGILAGRILPELEPQIAARDALKHLQAFIGHGRDDTKLRVEWAHRAEAWLTALGVAHETCLYPGDHGISEMMQSAFFAWFESVTGK